MSVSEGEDLEEKKLLGSGKVLKEVPPKSREMILNHLVEKPIEIDILVNQIKLELD